MIAADADRSLVEPLLDALAGTGRVWLDARHPADFAVLVASPRAADSPQVDHLLDVWAKDHPAADVLIVLVDGDLHWDIDADAFDTTASTALSLAAQRRFVTRPLWLDARGGVTAHLVARILAALAPGDMVRCPDCQQVTRPEDAFCPSCGAAIATAAPPPTGSVAVPARRVRRRWLVAAVVVAAVAGGVAFLALGSDDAPQDSPPSPVAPDSSSGTSAWVFVAIGAAFGLVTGVAISWRRRHPRRAAPTAGHAPPAAPVDTSATLPPPRVPRARATVFISHSFEADHQLALQLAADLRRDADVWVAPESIEPGESWLSSVERGLSDSRVCLALLSRASLASPWVLKEIQAAMELEIHRKLRLVPVEVEHCEVPILLRTYQILRLERGYGELVEQTRRLVSVAG